MFSFKSNHRRCSVKRMFPVKKGCFFFKKIRKLPRKTPLLESLLTKVAGLQACGFIKKRLQYGYFPVKFASFLRTSILQNICEEFLSHGSLFIIYVIDL